MLDMKNKHYSFLDQRRTDFDVDYDHFCKNTSEVHVSKILESERSFALMYYSELIFSAELSIGKEGFIFTSKPFTEEKYVPSHIVCSVGFQNQLKCFMDSTFESIQNTEKALKVLKTFERWVNHQSV